MPSMRQLIGLQPAGLLGPSELICAGGGGQLSGKSSREGPCLCVGGFLWGVPSFPAPPVVSMATAVAMVLLGEELVGESVDPAPPCPP